MPATGADPSDRLLADCYRNALRLAEEHGLHSLAFPSLSTGAFGYPMEEAAGVALATVREILPSLRSVDTIRFVLFSEQDRALHQAVLDRLRD